jgi:hypothetical protein
MIAKGTEQQLVCGREGDRALGPALERAVLSYHSRQLVSCLQGCQVPRPQQRPCLHSAQCGECTKQERRRKTRILWLRDGQLNTQTHTHTHTHTELYRQCMPSCPREPQTPPKTITPNCRNQHPTYIPQPKIRHYDEMQPNAHPSL